MSCGLRSQFCKMKSRIRCDNIFWFISLLSTTKIKFPKINLHDSDPMMYIHVHGRQLPKLLLHIQYYHLVIVNSNGNLNYCILSFIECGPVLSLRTEKQLPKPPQLVNSLGNQIILVHLIKKLGFFLQERIMGV